MKLLKKLMKKEDGATAIEYGLIAALISVVIIGAITALGDNLSNTFTAVSDSLAGAAADAPAEGG